MRGLAISLVVLGHTNQGIAHRGWWGTANTGDELQAFIYAFHMPAFFFVSGVFLRKSVERQGKLRFTLAKIRTILYPYALWTCIYLLASLLFRRFMVQAIPSWQSFLYNLLTGYGGWFLPALFFCLMLGMLVRKLPFPYLLVLSVMACLLFPVTSISFVDRGLGELPFLVVGIGIGMGIGTGAGRGDGAAYLRLEGLSRGLAMSSYVVLASVLLVLTLWLRADVPGLFLVEGMLGTAMLLMLARVLDQSVAARGLAWIGRASLGVFLMAPFPQGAGRALLQAVHVTRPYPQLLLPTLLAVLVPAWLYHHRTRLRLGWLFVSPW